MTSFRINKEKAEQYFENASRCLADGNELNERGKKKAAERKWEKGQFWLDKANKYAGNN